MGSRQLHSILFLYTVKRFFMVSERAGGDWRVDKWMMHIWHGSRHISKKRLQASGPVARSYARLTFFSGGGCGG